MGQVNPKFIGLSQFKVPYNYELAGQQFHLVMDCGKEVVVKFTDGEIVEYAQRGEPFVWDTYQCLKADETTYLVLVEPASGKGLLHYNLILDLEARLVTVVTMEEGYRPEYPRIIRTTPYFGAIKVPGRALPTKRHHLTDRMVGRHIVWHYNPGFAIEHIYHTATCVRADVSGTINRLRAELEERAASEDPAIREKAIADLEAFRRRREFYPFYEEESFHITINDHLNLFCFLEENMNMRDPAHHQGGGGILLLQDIERMIDMGVCFSAGEYYMCTAYGDENNIENELDTKESPYDWSKFEAMPSIYWDIPKDE